MPTIVARLTNYKEALFKAKLEELQVYVRHLSRCFAIFVSTDSEKNSICNWFSRKLKSSSDVHCVFRGAKYKYTLVTLNRFDCLRCFLSEITATVQLEKSFSF